MFDPRSFKTELRDQTVTVEIVRYWPAHDGSWDEPPEGEECEVEVFGDDGKMHLTCDEAGMVEALAIEHLKYAAQEVELERRLSTMEDEQ